MDRRALVVIAVLVATVLSGCSPLTGRAAARATGRSVSALTVEETQQDFAGFLRSPSMREAFHDLGESTGRGIAVVVSEQAPEIVDEFTSSERSEALVTSLAGKAAREAARELGTGIEEDLGPATARTIRRDVAPALAEGFDQHLRETLARSARSMSRESVLGAGDGFVELKEQPGGLLGGALRVGVGAAQLVILLVGVALGVLLALLLQSRRNERRERARAEAHEATLAELLGRIASPTVT